MGILINREQFLSITQFNRACLILNSRQSKRPCASDEWISGTDAAVRYYVSQDRLFLTSIGMNSWELVVHLVKVHGGRQVITIPSCLPEHGFDSPDDLLRKFRLSAERTHLFLLNVTENTGPDSWPQLRDNFLVTTAPLVAPVSVRPSGRLESLLSSNEAEIDKSFRVRYRKPVDRVRYDWNQVKLNPDLANNWSLLTHWTRSAFSALPASDHFDFYDAILNSGDYPYSAPHILEKILADCQVQASNRFIRGGYPVVSMTAQPPCEAIKLMRWRKRYAYYSFEPYGVAIEHSVATDLGCRPVLYGTVADFDALPEADRPFFQNIGSDSSDWQPEDEWRYVGTLNLQEIPPEAMRVITYRESEVEKLQDKCHCKVIAMTIGD